MSENTKADTLENALDALKNRIIVENLQILWDDYDKINKDLLLLFRINGKPDGHSDVFLTRTREWPKVNHTIYLTTSCFSIDMIYQLRKICTDSQLVSTAHDFIIDTLSTKCIDEYNHYEVNRDNPSIRGWHPSILKYIRSVEQQYYEQNIFVDMILKLLSELLR